MNSRILIIEDDREINCLLCKTLQDNGYIPISAFTGIDGLLQLKSEVFDLVLLDLMLPYKSGDLLLQELRSFSTVPVLILSAKELTQTKVDLLRLGADDYMTKPFDLDELLARIEANLRRSNAHPSEEHLVLSHRDIVMDLQSKGIMVNGKEVLLTRTEFKLLELLLSHPQKIFSKSNLFAHIWDEAYTIEDNTLNVHISRLRQKLKKANPEVDYIETLWGLGYRLTK